MYDIVFLCMSPLYESSSQLNDSRRQTMVFFQTILLEQVSHDQASEHTHTHTYSHTTTTQLQSDGVLFVFYVVYICILCKATDSSHQRLILLLLLLDLYLFQKNSWIGCCVTYVYIHLAYTFIQIHGLCVTNAMLHQYLLLAILCILVNVTVVF